MKLLMHEAAGMPAILTHLFPLFPGWSKLKAVAHTLAYDAAVMGDTQHGKPLPADRWAAMTTPTLVIDGGKSPAWMHNAAKAFTAAIPGAQSRTIPGQTHMVKPDALAPVLIEYFSA